MLDTMAAIIPANDLWGAADVHVGTPPVHEERGVVVYPDTGGCWGVLDEQGMSVEAASDRALPSGDLMHRIPRSEWSHASRIHRRDLTFVYGGHFNAHFGHFLLETLPRVQSALPATENLRIVMVGAGSVMDWFNLPHCADIFGAMGLATHHFMHIRRPTWFAELIVPEASVRMQSYAWTSYYERCLEVGRSLLCDGTRDVGPIAYLSKSRLTAGVRRLRDEVLVEQACQARGLEIIYPEQLSVRELLKLLRDRPALCGTVTSAHHAAVFLDTSSSFDLLTPEKVNSNFVLVDRLRGRSERYWQALGTTRMREVDLFAMEFAVPDPVAVANALCDAVIERVHSS